MRLRSIFILLMIAGLRYDMSGQSFEIPVYFEDAAGYQDTIVLGYDPMASYGIDAAFGEINIMDSSYHDLFEVRAATYDYDYFFMHGILLRVFESRRMIVDSICGYPSSTGEGNAVMVVIKSHHWPITISWDQNLFQDECHSLDIIDCTPGGWFDVCGGGHPHVLFEMRLADTVSYYDTEFKIETAQDTLSALFFRFVSDFSSGLEENPKETLKVFPNPVQGILSFDPPVLEGERIHLTDILGRPVPFNSTHQDMDLRQVPEGIYILHVRRKGGGCDVIKIIRSGH